MLIVTMQKHISTSIHFKRLDQNFNKGTKFTLLDKLNNSINTDIDTTKIRLKRREDFWLLKLDTLTPKGLNKELNNV